MGDSAEFEKLTALEGRLARALDSIAAGVAQRGESADRETAELNERIVALEGRLADTQTALAEAQAAQPSEDADAQLSRLAAEVGEKDGRISELEAALETSRAAAADATRAAADAKDQVQASVADDASAELQREIALLNRRVDRARADRDAAMEARDAAQDRADEAREGGAREPDARVLGLRAELRAVKTHADTLAAQLEAARGGSLGDADTALAEEAAALRALRAADAAGLSRILDDIANAAEGEVKNA